MITQNVLSKTLLQLLSLNVLINLTNFYQSHIPTCIEHISTNQKYLFKFSKTFETGLSDYQKLMSTTISVSEYILGRFCYYYC